MWQKLAWIALAGAAGSLARYGLAGLVQRWSGTAGFPWGTLAVNLAGCFLFGLVWGLGAERGVIPAEVRLVALAGFLGAFTTFSTFAFETGEMIRRSEWLLAGANALAQNVGGVGLAIVGMAAARSIL